MQSTEIDTPAACITALLRSADMRPTRQRVALGRLLFSGVDRHITAETLHEEVSNAGERISLATVYNTLHQFERAGLIRELAIDGAKTYFDTNTSNHSHFYVEKEGRVIDIPSKGLSVVGVPQPPEGTRISHIDVIVRLAKT
jgi:Fur family iron response transcriptional regulator